MTTMQKAQTIFGRKLYIPLMDYGAARTMAAAFQSAGIEAEPVPFGDEHDYEWARQHTSGDECLPELITLGSFLKICDRPGFDQAKTAFLMPTSNGPCRFGHYAPLAKKIFSDIGLEEVLIFSPTSSDGYESFGKDARAIIRTGWQAMVTADILRKMLLKIRPHEQNRGQTDQVYQRALDRLCQVIAEPKTGQGRRIKNMRIALTDSRDEFRRIDRDHKPRPKIGIVGEIYCRLDDFANQNLIRMLEKLGGEAWLSDIVEWVWYTNDEEIVQLKRQGRKYSLRMLGIKIKHAVMRHDEHYLSRPFKRDFAAYPEPSIQDLARLADPYLPRAGAHGEMLLNVGKAIWNWQHGCSGIIDISPFTCMNGIVCEAIYPRLSQDLHGLPIRSFYFDTNRAPLERDLDIFMELVKNYQARRVSAPQMKSFNEALS